MDQLRAQQTGIALSGGSSSGSVDLTIADTWYQIPSTVPVAPYRLIVSVENSVGTIRMSFSNGVSPSATNGNLAPAHFTLPLLGGQVIYYASSSAGDDVNWTTKII